MRRKWVILLGLAVLVVGWVLFAYQGRQTAGQQRGEMSEGFGQRKRVEYAGEVYVEKTNLAVLLFMGIDKPAGQQRQNARDGGQSDFMCVMVIDHQDKKIWQLQLDRDTITEVETMGILGSPTGIRREQLCLAHGYGNTDEENCVNSVKAVEGLLDGLEIDWYMAMSLDSANVLNDALGGVTVALEDDFSALDPAMTQGTTLHLTGNQAEIFVRSRMSIGDGTNESRMRRQRAFLSAALDVFREKQREEAGFAGAVYDSLETQMVSNVRKSQLLNEVNKAYSYEMEPVQTLAGEHRIGDDGYMEFHVADGAALDWLMQVCFEPARDADA